MIPQHLAPVRSNLALAGRVRRRPERQQRATCSIERLEQVDADLAHRACEAGRLRFEMGRGLHLLERTAGHHALGFSSIEAYALERCERSASWTQKARGLARRLEQLPPLADALISGSLNWSMPALLAAVARREDAPIWLAEAAGCTVREIKTLVLQRQGTPDRPDEPDTLEAGEDLRTLTLTVPREDAWSFETAKLLGRHLGERTNADLLLALVAESTSTLCNELPSRVIQLPEDDAINPQRAWERELARMRTQTEMRGEPHFRRALEPREQSTAALARAPQGNENQLPTS